MARVTNVNFTSDDTWTQATLPVSLGGLGVRKSQDIALPCFISSLHATDSIVASILSNANGLEETSELVDAINAWKLRYSAREEPAATAQAEQKSWDAISAKKTSEILLSRANQVDAARLKASARAESGLSLHAIPGQYRL